MVKRAAAVDSPSLYLSRASAATLPRQLADQFRAAVECGRLPIGARLPATRRLACTLGVSRNTVATAYEELLAEGIIEGRTGAGSYVVQGVRCLAFTDPDGNRLLLRAHEPRRTRRPLW